MIAHADDRTSRSDDHVLVIDDDFASVCKCIFVT
jgi:hypothetical protein